MGAELIATVLPKRTRAEYEEVIAGAAADRVARAAFNAGYQDCFGDDAVFNENVAERVAEEDTSVIVEIAANPEAIEAIRAAARNGANYITKRVALGGAAIVDASELGGPDMFAVGGSTHGDDPFEEFRSVAVLAALIAAESQA